MKKIFVIIVVGILFLSGCATGGGEESDSLKFKKEYEEYNGQKIGGKVSRNLTIDKNNSVVYLSVKQLKEKMDASESFVLYLGFPECPWCRSVISTLLEVGNDLGFTTIYYINIKEMRDSYQIKDGNLVKVKEGTEDYQTLLQLFDPLLDNYTLDTETGEKIETGEKRIYAPSIISIVDGKPQSIMDGISENQTDAFMELTAQIEKESYEKIKCSIECVANVNKICNPKKC